MFPYDSLLGSCVCVFNLNRNTGEARSWIPTAARSATWNARQGCSLEAGLSVPDRVVQERDPSVEASDSSTAQFTAIGKNG